MIKSIEIVEIQTRTYFSEDDIIRFVNIQGLVENK